MKYTLIIPSLLAAGVPQPGLPVEFDWINENWSGCSKSCASGNYPLQLTQLLLLTISCTWPVPQTTVNLWLSPSTKQRRNPCFRSLPQTCYKSTSWRAQRAFFCREAADSERRSPAPYEIQRRTFLKVQSLPVYQDLTTRYDWTVKNAIVNLPIRLKGNSKRISGN